jgi:hypothetical protein
MVLAVRKVVQTQKEKEQPIQELILQGVKDFYVRQKAIDILFEQGILAKDDLGETKPGTAGW